MADRTPSEVDAVDDEHEHNVQDESESEVVVEDGAETVAGTSGSPGLCQIHHA